MSGGGHAMKTTHIILAALGLLAAACLMTDIPYRIRGPVFVAAPFVCGTLWMGYSKRDVLLSVALASAFAVSGIILPPPWPAKLETADTIRIARNVFFVAMGVSLALVSAGRLIRFWVERKNAAMRGCDNHARSMPSAASHKDADDIVQKIGYECEYSQSEGV